VRRRRGFPATRIRLDTQPPDPYSEDDFDHEDSNRSANPHFSSVLDARLKRRAVLQGGLGLAVSTGLFGAAAFTAPDAVAAPAAGKRGVLGFTTVPVTRANTITVPPEYEFRIILPWGEPVTGSYPTYRDGGLNSGADQEQQMGMHHDGMQYFPMWRGQPGNRHGLLAMNHEYIDTNALHPSGATRVGIARDADQVRKEIAAHGVSVVEIVEDAGQ